MLQRRCGCSDLRLLLQWLEEYSDEGEVGQWAGCLARLLKISGGISGRAMLI